MGMEAAHAVAMIQRRECVTVFSVTHALLMMIFVQR